MDEQKTPALKWYDVCALEEIPDGNVLARCEAGEELLVYREGTRVTCVPNYCPHRGWRLDGGPVRSGVITCTFHGYEFRLDTGQCLTAPSLPLDLYPVRVREGRVEVQLKA